MKQKKNKEVNGLLGKLESLGFNAVFLCDSKDNTFYTWTSFDAHLRLLEDCKARLVSWQKLEQERHTKEFREVLNTTKCPKKDKRDITYLG